MSLKTNKDLYETDKKLYLPTFGRYPVAIHRGKGSRVWDVEGREYIDAFAGIAVNNVGHCHPDVVRAIRDQAGRLLHISNYYLTEPQLALAAKLVELSGLDRVFFSNSGAESVEGAIKIARKYAHSRSRGGTIVSLQGSFHGRTLATLATGRKELQNGFDPIPHGFIKLAQNNMQEIEKVYNEDIAGIIVEPIQGEGGINDIDELFLSKLRAFCDEKDISLIFDEVQTGIARTGKLFAKDHSGVQPDIMTLAKGLGGGVPIGAILSNEKVSAAMVTGDHGTTFGGNPLVCAAALAVLEVIEKENLAEAAREKGEWIREKVMEMNEPSVLKIKGRGLMIGIEFDFETKSLVREMLNQGVLANSLGGNILRLVPPLNISYEELEIVMNVLKKSIETVKANG